MLSATCNKVLTCSLQSWQATGPHRFSCCKAGSPHTYALILQEAAGKGAKLVVLPEMWNCPYSNDSFPVYAEDIDGGASPSADMLSKVTFNSSMFMRWLYAQ
jgi:Carbon-nitrogen hydrolase